MVNDYALLTHLPLLGGISSTELLGWEEAMRLDIDELPASKMPLIRQGDVCSQLLWLVEGELLREHQSADGSYTTRSLLRRPAVIEADRLFGLYPTYEHTYLAKTDVKVLNVGKAMVSNYMMKSEVFRFNLLNALSACAQKRKAALRPYRLDTAEERLLHFLRTVFPDCEGETELIIQMRHIAHYIGETRLTISRLLNRWHEEGNIRLGRGHFTIHDIGKLLNDNH